MSVSNWSLRAAAIAVVAGTLLLTACGSSRNQVTSVGASPAGSSQAQSASTSDALLTRAFNGMLAPLPSTTPKAPSGVSVWIVSCGQQAPACAGSSAAAQHAAHLLGWKATICDGQLNPVGWGYCIRQGIAAKVKVILPIAIDCPAVSQPLTEADKAGITTVAAGGIDCSEVGGPKVYTSGIKLLPDTTVLSWYRGIGTLAADWVIGATNGKANVLELNFTDAVWGPAISQGFESELKTCGGCKVARKLNISNQDVIGNTLTTKFSTALLQLSTVNTVWVPLDVWMTAGLAQAITGSGRSSSLKVIGALGDAANMALIRDGGEDASVSYDPVHYGYAAIDETIRVLDGQPTVPEGDGFQVVDKTHNLPASGPYHEPRAIVAAYQKLWGLG